jgi:branched-chain amino acid transport system permease protein
MSIITVPSDQDEERTSKRQLTAFAAMAIAFALVPILGIYPFFVMQALCFAMFACAFNLLIGYGGLFSLGHAMFLGTAGYLCGHAARVWHFPPELAILFGAGATAPLAAIAGYIAIRRRGLDFAMVTLALAQLLYFVYLQAPFTNGEDGIQAIPQGRLFGLLNLSDPLTLYYVVLFVFLTAFFIVYRTINSPFGEVLRSIRENEKRAVSLGYRTERFKLLAFVISGALSGLAGALKAIVAQNASLTDVHWTMSGEVVLMVVVGGLGTLYGPVVGAFVIIYMQFYLAALGSLVTLIQGAIFVACVLLFRRGIAGELAHFLKIAA